MRGEFRSAAAARAGARLAAARQQGARLVEAVGRQALGEVRGEQLLPAGPVLVTPVLELANARLQAGVHGHAARRRRLLDGFRADAAAPDVALEVLDDLPDVLLAVLEPPGDGALVARARLAQAAEVVRAVRVHGRRAVEQRPRGERAVEAQREAVHVVGVAHRAAADARARQERSVVERQRELGRDVARRAHQLHVAHTVTKIRRMIVTTSHFTAELT